MNPSQPSRRQRATVLATERLEGRELMTGGTGNSFALVSGTVATAGLRPTAVKVTIDPSHFTIPKGQFTLGIDVVPSSGSKIKPQIVAVEDGSGHAQKLTRSVYAANLPSSTVVGGQPTSAVQTAVHFNPANASATYTALVKGLNRTTGTFLLGFYLPGDTNGDGTVTQSDVTAVQTALGSKASASSTSKYLFDADANRDGRVTSGDLKVAQLNLGVSTTVSPIVTAKLDPASQTAIKDGALVGPTAHFTGVATPGAAVKFSEVDGKVQPVATTADASGNYSVILQVVAGTDTFQVSTLDAFGQAISGKLSPVTYNPTAATITPLTVNASTAKTTG